MKVKILGIEIDKINNDQIMQKIEEFLYSNSGHYIVTANPEIAVHAEKDLAFRDIINTADLVISDGAGLIYASKIISRKNCLNERISGIDLIYKITKHLDNSARKIKIFFLGARGDIGKFAALELKKNFPNVEIAGVFGGEAEEKGDRITVPIINQAKPDILLVAYGAPKQEKWIKRNLKKTPSVKLAIGVGGAFDIISGRIKRAPAEMRRAGFEWLWRLIQEPRRIGRIYNATIKFGWMILTKK